MVWLAGSERCLSKCLKTLSIVSSTLTSAFQDWRSLLERVIEMGNTFSDPMRQPITTQRKQENKPGAGFDRLTINFVAKRDNPTNVPQAQQIEDFWSILKMRVWDTDKKPKTIEELRERIKYCIDNFDRDAARWTFVTCKKRVRGCCGNHSLKIMFHHKTNER